MRESAQLHSTLAFSCSAIQSASIQSLRSCSARNIASHGHPAQKTDIGTGESPTRAFTVDCLTTDPLGYVEDRHQSVSASFVVTFLPFTGHRLVFFEPAVCVKAHTRSSGAYRSLVRLHPSRPKARHYLNRYLIPNFQKPSHDCTRTYHTDPSLWKRARLPLQLKESPSRQDLHILERRSPQQLVSGAIRES